MVFHVHIYNLCLELNCQGTNRVFQCSTGCYRVGFLIDSQIPRCYPCEVVSPSLLAHFQPPDYCSARFYWS